MPAARAEVTAVVHDTIVLGVGGMGSAVVDALTGRGQRVLGIEQFGIAHARGASHGQTRIVRQAYFESPAYIPLLRRAYQLWDDMPPACRLRRVGCLMIGHADSPVIVGASRSAATWGIDLQSLTASEVAERFPQFHLGRDDQAVFEADAGFVRPEATVTHLVERALARGATVLTGTTVTGWEAGRSGVRVTTAAGEFTAERLVITAGGWTPAIGAVLGLPIHVERRVMHFWEPIDPTAFAPAVMPTFIWDQASADSIYGLPRTGLAGVKVGFHNRGGPADPSRQEPESTPDEVAELRVVLQEAMPGVVGRHLRGVGCTYALTPDHDFVLGMAPGFDDRVVVAAGFSGHGFKFVPVVGEVVADLVLRGETPYDLGFLAPTRFSDPRPG
jgi:sarcosine oxidase